MVLGGEEGVSDSIKVRAYPDRLLKDSPANHALDTELLVPYELHRNYRSKIAEGHPLLELDGVPGRVVRR
jgi:hypothetical protein